MSEQKPVVLVTYDPKVNPLRPMPPGGIDPLDPRDREVGPDGPTVRIVALPAVEPWMPRVYIVEDRQLDATGVTGWREVDSIRLDLAVETLGRYLSDIRSAGGKYTLEQREILAGWFRENSAHSGLDGQLSANMARAADMILDVQSGAPADHPAYFDLLMSDMMATNSSQDTQIRRLRDALERSEQAAAKMASGASPEPKRSEPIDGCGSLALSAATVAARLLGQSHSSAARDRFDDAKKQADMAETFIRIAHLAGALQFRYPKPPAQVYVDPSMIPNWTF